MVDSNYYNGPGIYEDPTLQEIKMPAMCWIETLDPLTSKGVCNHLWNHGTFPRGHKATICSKIKRDKNRAKNKIARATRRLNPISPRTGNRSTGK